MNMESPSNSFEPPIIDWEAILVPCPMSIPGPGFWRHPLNAPVHIRPLQVKTDYSLSTCSLATPYGVSAPFRRMQCDFNSIFHSLPVAKTTPVRHSLWARFVPSRLSRGEAECNTICHCVAHWHCGAVTLGIPTTNRWKLSLYNITSHDQSINSSCLFLSVLVCSGFLHVTGSCSAMILCFFDAVMLCAKKRCEGLW